MSARNARRGQGVNILLFLWGEGSWWGFFSQVHCVLAVVVDLTDLGSFGREHKSAKSFL
jgi:hypothetical protein